MVRSMFPNAPRYPAMKLLLMFVPLLVILSSSDSQANDCNTSEDGTALKDHVVKSLYIEDMHSCYSEMHCYIYIISFVH